MNSEKIYIVLFTLIIAAIILVSIGAIILHQSQMGFIKLESPLKFLESQNPTQQSSTSEPVVTSWQTYSNMQYSFSMQIPAKWNTQDYAQFYPNGGTVIAFSPDELPCSTCSYFRNGYFSVKIYNQQTDPEYYTGFVTRMQTIGKDDNYQPITMHGKQGVVFANTVAVENNGWVYEFSLDKNNATQKALDSEILKKVLTSFQFTDLLFGN